MTANVNGTSQGQIQVSNGLGDERACPAVAPMPTGCDDNPSLDDLRARKRELEREVSRIEARIAEHLGQPARARFERIIAGDEQGDCHEAYIALRVEEYRERGSFYQYESAADLALIKAALGMTEADHAA